MTHIPQIWLTTDTHFNHAFLVRSGLRPQNVDGMIIQRWNECVNPCDVVVHLGDVIVGNDDDIDLINERLNGIKILVRGNHDSRSIAWYLARGFSFVCDQVLFGKVLLSHEPAKHKTPEWTVNVHGHLHRGEHRAGEYAIYPHHCLLSLEDHNYRPVLLSSFVQKHMTKIMRAPSVMPA